MLGDVPPRNVKGCSYGPVGGPSEQRATDASSPAHAGYIVGAPTCGCVRQSATYRAASPGMQRGPSVSRWRFAARLCSQLSGSVTPTPGA